MVDYIKITNIGLIPDKLPNRELLSFAERYDTTKSEIIRGSRIGSRVLYCEEDIKDAIKIIPILKYRRG